MYNYVEPEMVDLTKIVIPKIMTKWQYVAEALHYDLGIIQAIREHRDPKICCREFFFDWLTTKNGDRAGSKVWSTLLNILREIDEISTETVEEITAKVKQLKI